MQKNNPKYLDIPKIRLPIPGIVSILHRLTGIALFIGLPVFLWLLSASLNQSNAFEYYRLVITNPIGKLLLIGFLWALIHHALAGLRFLFLDIHIGIDLKPARLTAKLVAVSAPILAILIGVLLW